MNTYLAKKVSLDVMRECQIRSCSCFTSQGYYIQYHKSNIDSMIFVCEECFNRQFKAQSSLGSFDTSKYLRSERPRRERYEKPALRQLIKLVRDATRGLIVTGILVAVFLTVAYCIKEKPTIRNTVPAPTIHCAMNTEWKGMDGIVERVKGIPDRYVRLRKG